MPEVTVYDVARKAGVSIATVSRVLNAPDRVREATRQRVLAIIDELGYVPKAEAAARARRSHQRIGVLAPFFSYPSFMQRLRGVTMALAEQPCEVVICGVDSAADRESYLSSLAVTRRLDGLIVMALPFSDKAACRLLAHGLETVLIEFSHPAFSSIEIDDAAGGRLAAEYLLSKGKRRCAFIGDSDLPDYAIGTSERRLNGYCRTLAQAGAPVREHYISLAPHGLDQARQQAHHLLSLPEPPDAIFTASDTQAMGVLKAAQERGLVVPQDLAIVGFDDSEAAEYIGLTTVRQPLEESGRAAVDLLLARLADPSRIVQRVSLPLTLVQRETA